MSARRAAKRLRQRCGLAGWVDVTEVAHSLGLEVCAWPLPAAEVHEILVKDTIGVSAELGTAEQRWAIAHAIGHHVLHAEANSVWLRARTGLVDRFERQAEDFAFHLLVDLEEARAEGLTDAAAIAERYGVPLAMVLGWGV